MQGYLPTTGDLDRNAKSRLARVLGKTGDPYPVSPSLERPPSFGGMNFQGLQGPTFRTTADLPRDFTPGGEGGYPARRKPPPLPSLDAQPERGFGIGDAIQMGQGINQLGTLAKGKFPVGNPAVLSSSEVYHNALLDPFGPASDAVLGSGGAATGTLGGFELGTAGTGAASGATVGGFELGGASGGAAGGAAGAAAGLGIGMGMNFLLQGFLTGDWEHAFKSSATLGLYDMFGGS